MATKAPTTVTTSAPTPSPLCFSSVNPPAASSNASVANNNNKINTAPSSSINPPSLTLTSSQPLTTNNNTLTSGSTVTNSLPILQGLGYSNVTKPTVSVSVVPPTPINVTPPSVPGISTNLPTAVKSASPIITNKPADAKAEISNVSSSPKVVTKPADAKAEISNVAASPKVVTQPPLPPTPATNLQNQNQPVKKVNTNEVAKNTEPGTGSATITGTKMETSIGPNNKPSDNKTPINIPSQADKAMNEANKRSGVDNGSKGNKKEEIGEDVKRIMEVIENAGLCGPKQPEVGAGDSILNRSVDASGDASKVSKIGRPNLPTQSNRTSGTPAGSKPSGDNASPQNNGTNSGNLKKATSPTKAVPRANINKAAQQQQQHAASGNHTNSAIMAGDTISKGKAAPASGTTSSYPEAELSPKAASNLRTSTPRAASAKTSNSAPTSSAKTPNENKNSKAKLNGAASASADSETGTRNAVGATRSTPRLRPSSSLYRPTTSSALKGVSSAPHKSSSNNNLDLSATTPRATKSASSARASRSAITMGDSAGGSGDAKPATLRDQFTAFSRFGNKEEDGKCITLSNCDKWMKQAKVIDGKKITTTDTSICFKKLFKTAKKVSFEDFKKYVEELAKSKKMEQQEILDKLANCGPPGLSSATKAAHSNVVDRLTDTSKYTGSHKERFDASGKGRGIEGRKDVPDSSGYVAAFKDKLDIKDSEGTTSPTPSPAK